MHNLSLHVTAPLAIAAVLGIVALRLFFKTIRVGLLLAAPALLYVLYQH